MGIRLSFERSRTEYGVAVLAIPELDGFKFLSAFAFLDDLCAGAVAAALFAFADYLFDGKFGHRGDAGERLLYRTGFGVVVTIDG